MLALLHHHQGLARGVGAVVGVLRHFQGTGGHLGDGRGQLGVLLALLLGTLGQGAAELTQARGFVLQLPGFAGDLLQHLPQLPGIAVHRGAQGADLVGPGDVQLGVVAGLATAQGIDLPGGFFQLGNQLVPGQPGKEQQQRQQRQEEQQDLGGHGPGQAGDLLLRGHQADGPAAAGHAEQADPRRFLQAPVLVQVQAAHLPGRCRLGQGLGHRKQPGLLLAQASKLSIWPPPPAWASGKYSTLPAWSRAKA